MWDANSISTFIIGCIITILLCTIAHIHTDHPFSKSKIEYLNGICEHHNGVRNYSVDFKNLTVYCNADKIKLTTKAN